MIWRRLLHHRGVHVFCHVFPMWTRYLKDPDSYVPAVPMIPYVDESGRVVGEMWLDGRTVHSL